jgi:uncharacterized membrane protein HdeD (DUF308 family)
MLTLSRSSRFWTKGTTMADKSANLSTTTFTAARRIWATSFVRGALFLLTGLLMFFWPRTAVDVVKWLLIILFALQAILFVVEALRQSKEDSNGQLWRYALAVVAIAVAIALLAWPSTTFRVVFKVVAVWALISGVLGVVSALRGYQARKPAWDWEITTSLLWVIFGIMALLKSLSSLVAVVAAVSVYLTITGTVLLVAAWSLRVSKKDEAKSTATKGAPDSNPGAIVATPPV